MDNPMYYIWSNPEKTVISKVLATGVVVCIEQSDPEFQDAVVKGVLDFAPLEFYIDPEPLTLDQILSARAANYPSIQAQLDMQYWDGVNGTTVWADTIAKIKAEFPKP
jgi:hypothetical protein